MADIAGSPPADGRPWVEFGPECLAYANDAAGRWPLQVWFSAQRNDYWALASPASRENATAEGYSLYSHVGYVLAVDAAGLPRNGGPARASNGAEWARRQ
jgi:hypothetical protein